MRKEMPAPIAKLMEGLISETFTNKRFVRLKGDFNDGDPTKIHSRDREIS